MTRRSAGVILHPYIIGSLSAHIGSYRLLLKGLNCILVMIKVKDGLDLIIFHICFVISSITNRLRKLYKLIIFHIFIVTLEITWKLQYIKH